mmetsp:Transcript_11806/g.26777  ORF Transcript_11806/g.26777 Transcript_11806/m.26777 type:complete len:1065 (+) Transcript_11806:68-3262(+)
MGDVLISNPDARIGSGRLGSSRGQVASPGIWAEPRRRQDRLSTAGSRTQTLLRLWKDPGQNTNAEEDDGRIRSSSSSAGLSKSCEFTGSRGSLRNTSQKLPSLSIAEVLSFDELYSIARHRVVKAQSLQKMQGHRLARSRRVGKEWSQISSNPSTASVSVAKANHLVWTPGQSLLEAMTGQPRLMKVQTASSLNTSVEGSRPGTSQHLPEVVVTPSLQRDVTGSLGMTATHSDRTPRQLIAHRSLSSGSMTRLGEVEPPRIHRTSSKQPLPPEARGILTKEKETELVQPEKPKKRQFSICDNTEVVDHPVEDDDAMTGSDVSRPSSPGSPSRRNSRTTKAARQSLRRLCSQHSLASMNAGDMDMSDNFLEQCKALADRQTSGDFHLSESEAKRVAAAFMRFRQGGEPEVHKDDLMEFLEHLGYFRTNVEMVSRIANQVTPYSVLTLEELVVFVEKYQVTERALLQRAFNEHDYKKQSRLGEKDMEDVLWSLGVAPMHETVEQAMEMMGENRHSQVGYDTFLKVICVYRATEGFTRTEIDNLTRIYRRFSTPNKRTGYDPDLKIKHVKDALLYMFGPQANSLATKALYRLLHRPDEIDMDFASIELHEFLVWARRLRETEVNMYREQFDKFDDDHSGSLDQREIGALMHSLGYTPLNYMIEDMLRELDLSHEDQVEFDAFVSLMALFRMKDGFLEEEIREMKAAFQTFSRGQDTVTTLQLLHLLRHLGFVVTLGDVHRLIDQVNYDGRGEVDFREFLRLMRLHREEEISQVMVEYNKLKEPKLDLVRRGDISTALTSLGYIVDAEALGKVLGTMPETPAFDFDAFVGMIDKYRRTLVEERRMQAGYTRKEVNRFRAMFDEYDADGNNTVEREELVPLLRDLNIPMSTVQDQQKMLVIVDEARAAAVLAGAPLEDEIDAEGVPQVSFWTLVHLVRKLHNEGEQQELAREEEAVKETRFSKKEVAEFRNIFRGWARHHCASDYTVAGMLTGNSPSRLSTEDVQRFLRNVGINMRRKQEQTIENKIAELEGDTHGLLSFPTFLRLVRWMLDKDFGMIHRCLIRYLERQ